MWWLLGLLAALDGASPGNRRPIRPAAPSRVRMADGQLTYRSRDGSAFFVFRLSRIGDGIRLHIGEFPNPGVGSCHVLHDSTGPYICWSQPIRSTAEAKAVAAIWAEATIEYQRHGRYF